MITGYADSSSVNQSLAPTGTKVLSFQNAGSDCTGGDGTTGRTLTLTNTKLTQLIRVWINNTMLSPTNDFTVVNNATGSVITFVNAVDNTDIIDGLWWQ